MICVGHLSLWFSGKKKPAFVKGNAHGGKWIVSVAVLPQTDVLASGSSDGFIRLWKVNLKERTLKEMAAIPVSGFVNALSFPKHGQFLVAGIGKEHKFGRWEVRKDARNGLLLVALPPLGI